MFQKQKWQYASAGLNLFFIQLFTFLYAKVARFLNDWENHRTQSEYDELLSHP